MHFGSLVAALASFLDARRRGGEWLVRIEDLDPPRTVAGAADRQLATLEALGLRWDGPVLYQSTRTAAYAAALDALIARGLVYPCGCSRKEIAAHGLAGLEGPRYPGTCRDGLPPGRAPRAWRFATRPGPIDFVDRIQGPRHQDLANAIGDFVVRRADGIHAYQLAVVVDDAWQGITNVVRGADLIDSTPRQIALQQALGLSTPTYAHVPLVVDGAGRKLSKSDAAQPVDPRDPLPALLRAWAFLGQAPLEPRPASAAELLERAVAGWDIARVPRRPRRLGPLAGESSPSARAR
ncbi:tRNA glutamyl-Q(34) synthetase GluQRS [Thiococcus pfennigii]|uniref:tRNA glutamyl-Q(34) synthetase GluQRS n=1 Tax=Thiococcus pfennigii TaxID=1057 RepID=UPI001F5B4830|nr:tRNA glutamyl-Q(34) synthetase GluQRS [Thiococcus pfennigii]